jgi:hypothetical protein
VRFGAAGRTQTFLLAEPLEPRLRIGESIVIQTPDGPSIGQVHPHPEALETRRSLPPPGPCPCVASPPPISRAIQARPARARRRACDGPHPGAQAGDEAVARRGHARRLATDLHFTADERIDFRELVKELARFRTRIEMRQIGVRDEARLLGATARAGVRCAARRGSRRSSPSRYAWRSSRTSR